MRLAPLAAALALWLAGLAPASALMFGSGFAADPAATPAVVDLAIYLQLVVHKTTGPRVITGQYSGTAGSCFTSSQFSVQYPLGVTGLFTATGKYPGIEGAGLNEFNCGTLNSLAAPTSASATSLQMSSIPAWPTNADLPIKTTIATELTNPAETVTVTAISGSTWTVTPTQFAHSSGASVLPQRNQWADLSSLTAQLIADAHAGAVITLYWLPNNPWTGGPHTDLNCNGGTLADLVDPSKPVYTQWNLQVAHVAAALAQFQAAGVPVLFRPEPEFNFPSGYWWSSCMSFPTNAGQYAALWRDQFQQLTVTYGLHNMLWMFAVGGPNATLRSLEAYPGSSYVDIVGVDQYTNADSPIETIYPNWTSWAALGKIIAYPERGPTTLDGTSTMFEGLVASITSNPYSINNLVAFWAAWNSTGFSIVSNPGANALMNDPASANRLEVKAVLDCMRAAVTYAAKQSCVLN